MTEPLQVDINLKAANDMLRKARLSVTELAPLYRVLAGVLESETDQNFISQGRPAWAPLKPSTVASRMKRNRGSSVMQILKDRGTLAASVSSEYSSDHVTIGAGGAAKAYAAIQQFGGTIVRPPSTAKVRLRTDKNGNLVRQGDTGSAAGRAVFAKGSHKRVRETTHAVSAHSITIPARPYLPFVGSGDSVSLQPEAERSVLDAIVGYLDRTIG